MASSFRYNPTPDFSFNSTPTANQFDSTPASRSGVQIPDTNLGDIAKNMAVGKAKHLILDQGSRYAADSLAAAPAGSWANSTFTFVSDGIKYTKGLLATAADATKSVVGSAGKAISNALGTTAVNASKTGSEYLSKEAVNKIGVSTATTTPSMTVGASVTTAVIAFLGQKYLGGEAGTGATVGGTVGYYVGYSAGGEVGAAIGSAIGATIGAAIGSLFGSGKKSNRWQIARVGLTDHEGVYDHGYGYDASQPDKRFKKYSQSNADAAVNISNYLGSLSKNLETLTGNKLTDTLFVKVGSRSGTHLIKNDEWQAHSKDPQSFVRQSVDIVVDMYGGGAVIDELATKYGITREVAGDKYNMYALGAYQMELDAIQKEADRQDTLRENKQYQISQDVQREEEVAAGTRRGMPTRPGSNSFTVTPDEVSARQMPERPQGLLSNAI